MSETITIPTTPPRALLVSMAMRYDHSFGMPKQEVFPGHYAGYTEAEREALLVTMGQIYEEVVGKGFYLWDGRSDGYYDGVMKGKLE